jgi:hypothetical protein
MVERCMYEHHSRWKHAAPQEEVSKAEKAGPEKEAIEIKMRRSQRTPTMTN